MPEAFNITDVHSEEIRDIIGRTPPWLLTRGNIIIATITCMLLAGAFFMKYPDIISAPVQITSYDPPMKLVAQASGKISRFYANNGDMVDANKIIAVIDNPANTNDMLSLKAIAESIDTSWDIRKTIATIRMPVNAQVGELQPDYSALYEAINNYNFFLRNAYYSGKLAAIDREQDNNGEMETTIKNREKILNDQLRAEVWKDSVNKILLQEKVISLSEYNEMRKGYLSQHLNNEDNINSLLQNKQQKMEFQKSVSDIRQQHKTAEKDAVLSVKSAAKRIIGQISIWEKQYVLKAPSPGKLVFFTVRKINQYVKIGTAAFMVVPATGQYEIRVQLPLYKAGKVKIDQPVLIKLQEYPYEEYGMLKAKVISITNVAIDSAYFVDLRLENGLKTTRNRTIEPRPEISGMADIITTNKSILQRIFESLYGKLNER